MRNLILIGIVLLSSACSDRHRNKVQRKNVGASSFQVQVNSTSTPLELKFSNIKSADRLYILKDADENCQTGESIGFESIEEDKTEHISRYFDVELEGSFRVLLVNQNEHFCSTEINYSLSSQLSLKETTMGIPQYHFEENGPRSTIGPVRMIRKVPTPQYDNGQQQIIEPLPMQTLTAGGGHSCTIMSGGKVYCWGNGSLGRLGNGSTDNKSTPTEVTNINNAIGLDLGDTHSCALLANGKVNCWGDGGSGRLGNSSTSASPIPVEVHGITNAVGLALGKEHSCALLLNGRINCWGSGSSGRLGTNGIASSSVPVEVNLITNAVGIEAGVNHTCALLASGKIMCWGFGSNGKLGNKLTSASLVPVEVQGISNALGISLGENHTCAILSDGKINCWGDGSSGQLGQNLYSGSLDPQVVQGINSAVSISSGDNHTCALLLDGKLKCWGVGTSGRLGNNSTANSSTPVEVQEIISGSNISLGGVHSCSLTADGKIMCWGNGTLGRLGNNLTSSSTTPIQAHLPYGELLVGQIDSEYAVKNISKGVAHTCALNQDQTITCIGENANGELGNSSNETSYSFVKASNIDSAISIDSGKNHSCAVLGDGKMECWGINVKGQLGNGLTTNSNIPVEVQGIDTIIVRTALGEEHTCVLTNKGKVFCWGSNISGQLGDQTFTNSLTPVEVQGISSAVDIAAGSFHTCALLHDGKINCWGNGANGRLGNNSLANSNLPIEVKGISNARSISLGENHSCALLVDGKVNCWGNGSYGRLGDNLSISSSIPVIVHGITTAVAITLGDTFTCALLADGKINCWGNGSYGRLGHNSTLSSAVPVEVQGIESATSITSNGAQTCATLEDKTISCWGDGVAKRNDQKIPSLDGLVDFDSSAAKFMCFVLKDNSVQCAGNGKYLGLPTANPSQFYTLKETSTIPELSKITTLSAADKSICALDSDGSVTCWGENTNGQLATGDTLPKVGVQNVSINSGEKISALASGATTHCSVTDSKKVFCWGTGFGNTPIEVASLQNINFITMRDDKICAINNQQKVFCQGSNSYGELGKNPALDNNIEFFEEVAALAGAKKIAIFTKWSCGLYGNENELKCWGENQHGQLGVDPLVVNSTFTPVSTGISDVTSISFDKLGGNKTLFLKNGRINSMGGGNFSPSTFGPRTIEKFTLSSQDEGVLYSIVGNEKSLVITFANEKIESLLLGRGALLPKSLK